MAISKIGSDGLNQAADTILCADSGNVGIGTSSPVSTAKTSIKQAAGGGAGSTQLHLEQSNTTDGYDLKCDSADGALAFLRYASGSATERMRILSSGGITFNGDTAAANALDDYEEGTWTPNVWHNSSNNSTWSIKSGFYRKIGSVVYCWFRVDGGNSGTAGSQLFLTGVPFTPNASNPSAGTFGMWAANGLTPQTANIFWSSSNVFQIYNGGNGMSNQTSYMSGFFSYNA